MKALVALFAAALTAGCAVDPTLCDSDESRKSGDACASTEDCCVNPQLAAMDPTSVLTCSRFGRSCRGAKNLPLGETCTRNEQCQSANCNEEGHSCTKACIDDDACDWTVTTTACVNTYDKGWLCRPRCTSDADCLPYGAKFDYSPPSCRVVKNRSGLSVKVCVPW